MECNKDEAIRAKQIAEKKMESRDFEGAFKIAQKAQALYPELENISQLLSICNVHCSAQTRIGADKDWYGILQIEKLSDELTVKKQYRRLALHLHPDKNRFPGAEAAFKLIVEANSVLSDPAKKSFYDSRIRAFSRPSGPVNLPPHHTNVNRTYQFSRQYGAPGHMPGGFTGLNQHQAAQSSHSVSREMFVTSCPFCSMRHQHPRTLLKTMLTCHNCLKKFVSYEITCPGVMGVNLGQGNSVSPEASQWRAKKKVSRQEAGQRSAAAAGHVEKDAKVGVGVKEKHVDNRDVSASQCQKEGVNGVSDNREKVNKKHNGRKRGRKVRVSSSKISDSSSDSDSEDASDEDNFSMNSDPSDGRPVRRSSRVRQNVSYTYMEGDGDDDDDDGDDTHLNPPKRPRGNEVSEDIEEEHDDCLNQKTNVSPEESKQAKGIGEGQGTEKDISGNRVDAFTIQTQDPEFNDFDKLRDESLFAVNQIWACYDSNDGMPRFHAKIKKVSRNPFELSLTWLEPDPIDDAHNKWIMVDLPVGCGTFKLGQTMFTDANNIFSHQVLWEKGKKRGSFLVYPRSGETWALFRDWNLNWSSSPDDHKVHKYEIVEILSDFDPIIGLKVCYLDKVAGFVSLFRSNQDEANSFLVHPNELYRLSHRVLSYKMTGSEREGVPAGSFELDTAALPLNHDDLYYPGKAKMGLEKTGNGAN